MDMQAYTEASSVMKAGSSSFASAARLLDAATRDSVQRLYAWCRYCDDVVDGQILGRGATFAQAEELNERVTWLRDSTLSALRGQGCVNAAFRGLQDVAHRHGIGHAYPLALIDGFAMDAAGRPCVTLDDTILYAYHVAGAVGIMMATVLGVTRTEVLRRACDLGIAFQLSNIARDVMDDAAVGRIYLPLDWVAAEGVEPAAIIDPAHREAVARVTARLVEAAEPYYASARIGIGSLPVQAALAIAAARGIYRDIGRLVRARGATAWDNRTVVGRKRRITRAIEGAGMVLRQKLTAPFLSENPREGLWTPAELR